MSMIKRIRNYSSDMTKNNSPAKLNDNNERELYILLKTKKNFHNSIKLNKKSNNYRGYNLNDKELVRSIVLEDNPRIGNIRKMRKKLVIVNNYYLQKDKIDYSENHKLSSHLEEVIIF
jgi:hypothetical protein